MFLLLGIKSALPAQLQAKLVISIRSSLRERIKWNEASEMPLPSSPPRNPRSLSHASRREAASWVWILAPPELSGLPHNQEKGHCPGRRIYNHMDTQPSTSPEHRLEQTYGRSHTIPWQPSEKPKLISKSLCFNHVHRGQSSTEVSH